MTNTIENKQRFFALYFGQEVLIDDNLWKHKVLGDTMYWDDCHLELKSLSDITKEESDYIKKLKVICHSDGSHDLEPMQHTTDYLRSRGYLLPFMGLAVEQILAHKWAVIK